VGRLRAYGNAISPYAAKTFIEAYCEAVGLQFDLTIATPRRQIGEVSRAL
jgi:hypothetical protein